MTDTPKPVLADRHTLTFLDGTEKEVVMTFGLLNLVSGLVRDISSVPFIMMDPELRHQLMIALLSPRDAHGKITDEYNEYLEPVSTAEAQALLTWVSEHLTDFFLKAVRQYRTILETVEQENPGALNSASTTAGSVD
ncbi:hypothetical protein PU634_10305 [Oceanimonas pelagia]|uniref:Uncharacterized protein n=1 Tax=Oceanimonas pelagia TaxID=3028314 RepID=A0AA50KM11_9GAMM|nr:hypothetical protein [Oceanimonas pelagia]WMC09507.1 hypothetical protein PU634_10305 [Oceanimonas pelagia]